MKASKKLDCEFLERIASANDTTPDEVTAYLRDIAAGRTPRQHLDLTADQTAPELTADDCMEFLNAASAYHRYMIRKEAKAAGLSTVAYLRRELPALIREGRAAA